MAKQLLANLTDATLFLQEWLQRPQQIGAVLPSSRNLAVAMAGWLPTDPDEFVIELGPGTGSVTQAILGRGLRHDRLIAIEKSSKLAERLRNRFPRVRVVTGDAEQLDKLVKRHIPRGKSAGAIISSLPLRNFKADAADALVKKIRAVLRPDGRWVQYSYHLGNQRPKSTGCFDLICSDVVWWNFPPARISVYQKPAADER